jgi:hypothetical protein
LYSFVPHHTYEKDISTLILDSWYVSGKTVCLLEKTVPSLFTAAKRMYQVEQVRITQALASVT